MKDITLKSCLLVTVRWRYLWADEPGMRDERSTKTIITNTFSRRQSGKRLGSNPGPSIHVVTEVMSSVISILI
jgi:hypothetical protein